MPFTIRSIVGLLSQLTAAVILMSAMPLFLMAISPASAASSDLDTTDDTRRIPVPPPAVSNEPLIVLRGANLIVAPDEPPIPDAVLTIDGNRIDFAGRKRDFSTGDREIRDIDASGLYVLPGLVDLHIHFTSQRGDDAGRYRDSDAAATIRGMLLIEQLLDAGITAVRDVGTRNDVALKIKEAVARGMVDGPRVLWSGQRIVTRAGHGDEIVAVGSGRPKSLAVGDRERLATGPWEWRLAVREQIRMQADWIKLTSPYTREEVAAAIDEAHLHGIPVTVDSFGRFSRWAAEAGIDGIEHPLDLDGETIAVMAQNGTALVPTLTTFHNLLTEGYPSISIPAGGFYFTMARRFPIDHEKHLADVKAAHDAGVRIGVGTDIPIEADSRYPDSYYTELGHLREAGLTDREVLAAATSVGAEILGIGDKLGRLRKDMLADILVVSENPLDDIDNLRDVRMVIADGKIVRCTGHALGC